MAAVGQTDGSASAGRTISSVYRPHANPTNKNPIKNSKRDERPALRIRIPSLQNKEKDKLLVIGEANEMVVLKKAFLATDTCRRFSCFVWFY